MMMRLCDWANSKTSGSDAPDLPISAIVKKSTVGSRRRVAATMLKRGSSSARNRGVLTIHLRTVAKIKRDGTVDLLESQSGEFCNDCFCA